MKFEQNFHLLVRIELPTCSGSVSLFIKAKNAVVQNIFVPLLKFSELELLHCGHDEAWR